MKVRAKEVDNSIEKLLSDDKKEFYRCMKELEPSMNPAFYDE